MKKLLMISHSSKMTGGGEDDFRRLLDYFSGKYKIFCIIPEGPEVEKIKSVSSETLVIPDKIFPFEQIKLKTYVSYLYYSVRKIFIMLPFLFRTRNNIDICYVNSSVCLIEMLLLYFLKIPYVLSIKEIIEPSFVRKTIYKFFNKSGRDIIVISKLLNDLYVNVNKNAAPHIIRSSIDHVNYAKIKADLNKNVMQKEDCFNIVNIGVITESKNQKLLIDAIANIKSKRKSKIYFIGKIIEFSYYNYLKTLIKNYNLDNVEFVFTMDIPKEEVLKKIFISDCVVITSRKEGMSLVLVESLFMEKPVISTKVGVVPEILEDGINGFLINDDDFINLAFLIERLQTRTDLTEITGNLYETYLNNFSIKYFIRKHEEIIFRK